MESCGESIDYCEIEWHIENFHFCWHKTGERLESPLFTINTPCETSWKLWLYPRGEDDGEYISCYLFRAEGGPEYVDVDFDLSLFIRDILVKPKVYFSKIYSFKPYQREGLGCFASRWKVFAPKASQKDNYCTLIVCCRIFNPSIKNCETFLFTRIVIERVYGTEIFDPDTDGDSVINKAINVKPILEDKPLININLLYVEKSLVMKICPVNCKDIKYATIKISVIDNHVKKSLNRHDRSWIGEIKTSTFRYKAPRSNEELAKLDIEDNTHETFLLHYDFTFSTGLLVEKCGFGEYESDIKFSKTFMQQCWNRRTKNLESAQNAVEALVGVCRSGPYFDEKIVDEKRHFQGLEAILCSRTSIITHYLDELPIHSSDAVEAFLNFLYSDVVEFTSLEVTFELYALALRQDVKLLATKCRKFLMDNLEHWNACFIFEVSSRYKDLQMKDFVEDYIVTYYDLILTSANWKILAENDPNLSKTIILLKYKKYKCNIVGCVNDI